MTKVRFKKSLSKAAAVVESAQTGNEGVIYFGTDGGVILGGEIKGEANVLEGVQLNGVDVAVSNKKSNLVVNGGTVKLDNYAKASEAAAIAATDTVNQALGKLEKALEDVGGDAIVEVEAGNGIEVSAKADHKQTVSAKVAEVADGGEQWLSVDEDGLKVAGIKDYVAGEIGALDVTDAAVTGKIVKAVSEEDGKISVSRDFLAATDIKLAKLGSSETAEGFAAEYQLVNGNNVALGVNIQIPKDQFLKSAEFYATKAAADEAEKTDYPANFQFPGIRFEFETSAGTSVSWISVKDLVDVYTAGNGIDITNNVVSAKVHASDYIKVDANGLYTDGIDDAISDAVAAEAEIARAAEQANAAAISAEEVRATAAEAANKALIDAMDTAYKAADTALGNRIAVFEADGAHDVAALETRVGTAEGNITTLQADVTTIKGKPAYAITTSDINAWNGEIGAKAAISDMDASYSDATNGLKYSLTQVDGKITAFSASLEWE